MQAYRLNSFRHVQSHVLFIIEIKINAAWTNNFTTFYFLDILRIAQLKLIYPGKIKLLILLLM
jgi:hypothetical protein